MGVLFEASDASATWVESVLVCLSHHSSPLRILSTRDGQARVPIRLDALNTFRRLAGQP